MQHLRALFLLLMLCPFVPAKAQDEEELDSAALMNALMEMFNSDAVTVKAEYVFGHNVHYKSGKTTWEGEEKEEFDLYFSSGSQEIAMAQVIEKDGETGNLFAVFDLSTNAMASFIEVDTMKMCMRMKLPDTGDKGPGPVFTRSGKSKRIAGHEAFEWTATDDGEEVRLWIAESTVGDLGPVFSAFGDLHGQGGIQRGEYGGGLVLAGSSRKTEGTKPHFTFEATKVELNKPFTFKSEGYQLGM